jgi:FkbM family methyltransferase
VLKKIVKSAAEKCGYSIVPAWQLETLALEQLERQAAAEFTRKLLTHIQCDCVLDVGANAGQFRDFLREQVKFDGLIISFEPIPWHAKTLRARSVLDASWHVEDCALGRTPGHATFNVMADTQFSSFLSPADASTHAFEQQNRVVRHVEVEVRTLDRMLPQLAQQFGFRAPYLKLDTQGYDLEVLAGAAEVMDCIRALQTEASVTGLYAGAPDYATTIRTVQDAGFCLSGMFPNNPSHFPVLHEFDCYMIAREALRRSR